MSRWCKSITMKEQRTERIGQPLSRESTLILGADVVPVTEGNTDAKDATDADKLPELLATARQRALSAEEATVLADALRRHEPWLEWSGKREKPWFEVAPVALHMHERVSTQAVLAY